MNCNIKKRLIWNAVPTLFDVPNPPKAIAVRRPAPKSRMVVHLLKRKTNHFGKYEKLLSFKNFFHFLFCSYYCSCSVVLAHANP